MDIYKWDDRLKINHPKIDKDHQLIIEKARELSEFMMKGQGKEKIVSTVEFLSQYVKTHFQEEEALQRKNNFPHFEEHQKNHRFFITQLNELTEKIKNEPTSAKNAIELNKLISGWFVNHIKKMDVEVAKHLKNESGE